MGRMAEALKRADRERAAGQSSSRSSNKSYRIMSSLKDDRYAPAHGIPSPVVPTSRLDEPATADEITGRFQGISEALVPFYDRSNVISEQYRSLRTRLLSQNPAMEHRVLAITSAIPREGKSVTTLNLGFTFAEIRQLRVMIVDGDFRRSTLAKLLGMDESPGLADHLADKANYEDIVRATPLPNLCVVPAGYMHKRSAAELLTDVRARQFFRRAQEEFDYVFVDTPPATTVSDVGVIGQMSDGVIMLVRLNRTQETDAKRAVRLLQNNSIPILGCLIVGRDVLPGAYGYGYGYGSEYRRYYSEYYNSAPTDQPPAKREAVTV